MLGAITSRLGYETLPAGIAQKSFYELKAALPGKDKVLDFATLKGKVVLIVNTASKCGFTYQYGGLEELYKSYRTKGLEVLGFPSDQFGHQEPGTDDDISSFCTLNHGVTFPLAKKSDVNGKDMNEVFAWLKSQPHSGGVGGTTNIKVRTARLTVGRNFTKFLVDKEGRVVGRWSSTTKPEALKSEIEKLL
ncbi:glutathione peroxidase, partial [Tremellales sp. Uapishka_1]